MSNKFPLYKTTKSDEWYARAAQVIPSGVYGHLGPAEGQFIPVNRWPRFSEKAKGSYFWDVDGNKYIDYMCAYGPNVLGYGDEDEFTWERWFFPNLTVTDGLREVDHYMQQYISFFFF